MRAADTLCWMGLQGSVRCGYFLGRACGMGRGRRPGDAQHRRRGRSPRKPPGGRLGLRPKPVPCSDLPSPEMDFYHAIKWTRYLGAAKSRWSAKAHCRNRPNPRPRFLAREQMRGKWDAKIHCKRCRTLL